MTAPPADIRPIAPPPKPFQFGMRDVALVMLLSLFVVPLYPGLAMAFVALMQTRTVANLKRKYDPQPEQDEEPL